MSIQCIAYCRSINWLLASRCHQEHCNCSVSGRWSCLRPRCSCMRGSFGSRGQRRLGWRRLCHRRRKSRHRCCRRQVGQWPQPQRQWGKLLEKDFCNSVERKVLLILIMVTQAAGSWFVKMCLPSLYNLRWFDLIFVKADGNGWIRHRIWFLFWI